MIKDQDAYYLPLKKRSELLDTFHLGASGWRKVFFQQNNKITPKAPNISLHDQAMLTSAFFALGDFFRPHVAKKNHYVVVARDTRPSGAEILACFCRVFEHLAIPTQNAGMMALPELLAHVSQDVMCDGFIYFSASHNPPEHNGIKLGLRDGCVLNKKQAEKAISIFRRRYLSAQHKKDVEWLCTNILPQKENATHPDVMLIKKMHEHYKNLIEKISFFSSFTTKTTKAKRSIYRESLEKMKKTLHQKKQSIVIDYNGSARLFCCEKKILEEHGLQCHALGEKAGEFHHDIVPEGKSLDFLEQSMKKLLDQKKNIFAGMVVDCDGDRGNLLLVSPSDQKIWRLSAQHTFALGVWSDLATLQTFFPNQLKNLAIIVNAASSLVIDHLCALYGVRCFRSETGEANVLKLAEKKKKQGYKIRMAGEGSNGGSIVFPHTVRDPLTTVLSILRLCYLKKEKIAANDLSEQKWPSPKKNGSPKTPVKNSTHFLENILEKLNQFRSTAVFEKEALLDWHSPHLPEGKIKKLKQRLAKKCWEDDGRTLKKWLKNEKITVKIKQYLGDKSHFIHKKNLDKIKDAGGLVVYFCEKKSPKEKIIVKGFWWMRASQTESKLRCATEWSAENNEKKNIDAAEKMRITLQRYLYDFLLSHSKKR